MAPTQKLYVLVRSDLGPGPRVAQAVHGTDEFRDMHPGLHAQWRKDSNTVAVLGVQDEAHLNTVREQAERYGVPFATFREPDLANASTVLVLAHHPATKKITGRLPLLG